MVGQAAQRGRVAAPERGRAILRRGALVLICLLAVAARLNKVVRFGDDLHDWASPGTPLFDQRTARELAGGGFPTQHAASHPALSAAAALAHWLVSLAMAVDLQYVCAAIVPVVSAPCCILVYALGKEVSSDAVGLVAAGLFALLPASTAAMVSFSAQGLSLLPMQLSLYFYLRALKGELSSGTICNAVAAASSITLVSLTWRPGAVFMAYLLPFHVSHAYTRRCVLTAVRKGLAHACDMPQVIASREGSAFWVRPSIWELELEQTELTGARNVQGHYKAPKHIGSLCDSLPSWHRTVSLAPGYNPPC